MHQFRRRGIKANWRVLDRRTADREKLALARQDQIGGLFTDHLAAFRLSSILRIDCRAVDGLIALALVTKNLFHRKLADLDVKLFELAFPILSFFDLV